MKERILVLPNIDAMLTGVYMMKQNMKGGPITLIYTDGEIESSDPGIILDENVPVFATIGDVQDCARHRGPWAHLADKNSQDKQ